MHCVDLAESFPTSICLQNMASIQPRTSLVKFVPALRVQIAQVPQIRRAVREGQRVVHAGLHDRLHEAYGAWHKELEDGQPLSAAGTAIALRGATRASPGRECIFRWDAILKVQHALFLRTHFLDSEHFPFRAHQSTFRSANFAFGALFSNHFQPTHFLPERTHAALGAACRVRPEMVGGCNVRGPQQTPGAQVA